MAINRETVLSEAGIGDDMLITEDIVASTNLLALSLGAAGAKNGTAVMAGAQTAGRGRKGRSFWSPESSGMYLSIVVRPENDSGTLNRFKDVSNLSSFLTASAGVCTAGAIDELFNSGAKLKWVNDVIIGGRKAGGILVEGVFEGASFSHAAVGIGVNIYCPASGFPGDIREKAGAVFSDKSAALSFGPYASERLAGRIIKKFSLISGQYFSEPDDAVKSVYDDYYKRIEWMIGTEIIVNDLSGTGLYGARVNGLDRDFGLIVSLESGKTLVLKTGEVSIRPKDILTDK